MIIKCYSIKTITKIALWEAQKKTGFYLI